MLEKLLRNRTYKTWKNAKYIRMIEREISIII